MHEVRLLGPARLELIAALKSQIAFSDFCVPPPSVCPKVSWVRKPLSIRSKYAPVGPRFDT
jgi:hypothetical protein